MDKRKIANYVNIAGLISFIIGRETNISILVLTGLGIITLSSIWTIIHWKENNKITYIGMTTCLAILIYVGILLTGM